MNNIPTMFKHIRKAFNEIDIIKSIPKVHVIPEGYIIPLLYCQIDKYTEFGKCYISTQLYNFNRNMYKHVPSIEFKYNGKIFILEFFIRINFPIQDQENFILEYHIAEENNETCIIAGNIYKTLFELTLKN